MTNQPLYYKRHDELSDDLDPMGESLINRDSTPFKVWIPQEKGLVLGNSQKPELELKLQNCLDDQVPIYKRRGGGGTVLLSPKGLCFGIRFKKQKSWAIHDYFETGTGILQSVLQKNYGIESIPRGISDLCISQKKILGCSLYLPRDYGLYLAAVLIEPDLEAIEKYLAHPSKEPDYRVGRTHRDFLTFLAEETSGECTNTRLQKELETEIESSILEHLDFNLDSN